MAATRTRTGGDATRSAPRRTSADIGEQAWHASARHADGVRRTSLVAIAAAALAAGGLAATDVATAADPTTFLVRAECQPALRARRDARSGSRPGRRGDAVVASGTVDTAGSSLGATWTPGLHRAYDEQPRDRLRPGDRDRLRRPAAGPVVLRRPDADQGFGYITTRDGTTLSANVSLPPGHKGPYPTVVEYSGYDPSNPDSTTSPSSTRPRLRLRRRQHPRHRLLRRFVPFFEPVQSLDGYDVIETVAAQPWASHQVGMVGISYPGIAQLFVAQTQPPHLAAITPLSVIDDTYRGTLYPGGILNTGFAVTWAQERDDAGRALRPGLGAGRSVDAGDTVCAANQKLRLQNPDLLQLIDDNPYYSPAIGDPIAPAPSSTRSTCRCSSPAPGRTSRPAATSRRCSTSFTGSPHVYATLVNGSHTESLSLGVFRRYVEFLDLYVGHAASRPRRQGVRRADPGRAAHRRHAASPAAGHDFTGLTYEQALAKFESQSRSGSCSRRARPTGQPSGAPLPRFEQSFASWPIPSARRRVVPHAGRRLSPRRRPAPGSHDAQLHGRPDGAAGDRLHRVELATSGRRTRLRLAADPRRHGPRLDHRAAEEDGRRIGTGSVDLWVRSSAADTDLEVTSARCARTAREIYVQTGWLRASHRALDRGLDAISPVHTDLEADAGPLPAGRSPVRVELFPFAHPSGRARGSASPSTRPATPARCGPSTRSPTASRSPIATEPRTRRSWCCRSWRASTCRQGARVRLAARPAVPDLPRGSSRRRAGWRPCEWD